MEVAVKAQEIGENNSRPASPKGNDETIHIELPDTLPSPPRSSLVSGFRRCVTYGYSVVNNGIETENRSKCDKRCKVAKMQTLALCFVLLLTAGVGFLVKGFPLQGGAAPDSKNSKNVVDLSYPYDNSTMYWPGLLRFELESTWKGTLTPGGVWYQANKFCASEHGGTHMDAPNHFQEGQWAVDEIPFERFIAPAVVLNITERASRDPKTMITVKDAQEWEKVHGPIPKGAVILMYSGWGQYWGNRTAFFGDDEDSSKHSYPGIDPELANWAVKNREVYGFGVDTPSTDVGTAKDFPTHRILSANNIYGLEMVANLEKLPPSGATLYAMPMKIKGGTGGPTRVFALLP